MYQTRLIVIVVFLCFETFGQIPPINWVKSLGTAVPHAAVNKIHGLKHDSKNSIYIVGSFQGIVDFDPTDRTYTLNSGAQQSEFLMKCTPSGNLQWVRCWKNISSAGIHIAVDSSDNVYLAGWYSGIESFSIQSSTYTINTVSSSHIMKLSPKGNFLWVRELLGDISVADLVVDKNEEPLIVGDFRGKVNFERTTSTYTFSSSSSVSNLFFGNFSVNGNVKYIKRFSTNSSVIGLAAAISDNNELYLSAISNTNIVIDIDPGPGYTGSKGNFIAKYDSIGSYLEHIKITGDTYFKSLDFNNGLFGCGTILDASNCLFIKGSQTLSSVPGAVNNPKGIFFLLDTSLSPVFIKEINPGQAQATSVQNMKIKAHSSSNIYLFSEFEGVYDLDPSPAVSNCTAPAQYFGFYSLAISKYSSTGDYIWGGSIGQAGFSPLPCDVDLNEAVFTSARYDYSVDVDPTQVSEILPAPVSRTAFISRLFYCRKDQEPTLYVNQDQQYICEGDPVTLNAYGADYYYWEPEADDISTYSLIASESKTIEVFGYDNMGCYSSLVYTVSTDKCTGLLENNSTRYAIYPNPSTGIVRISAVEGDQLTLTDSAGRDIKRMKIRSSETVIDLSDLNQGVYLVQLSDSSGKLLQSKKVVKK